jgi:hypothetical protein
MPDTSGHLATGDETRWTAIASGYETWAEPFTDDTSHR